MMHSTTAFLGAWILVAGSVWAQPAATPLAFETASVKVADPHAKRSGLSTRNANDLIVENWPVRNLIKFAYGLQDFSIGRRPQVDRDGALRYRGQGAARRVHRQAAGRSASHLRRSDKDTR
ncbi:exported hypothetical protein [Candidatus Sulfopaludibacter sp. SbA3]|nr:exported hypothetical protein [Candidatus Sulfopaludibacter sp. SbA3]